MPNARPRRSVARQDELIVWLKKRHGVAHSSDARAAGFTVYDIAGAVEGGQLQRIRRSWLVTPDCDERRRAAARVSGRVTCVSSAALRGLWLPDSASDARTHVAVPGNASRFSSDGLHLHWGAGPAPVGRNENEDAVVNVLFHIAQCLPQRDALAVWESAIRRRTVDGGMLTRVAWRSSQAAALASVASSLSDSGLESFFVDGMRRAGITAQQQVWIDGHPVDGLIGASLAVQIDGFAHHSSAADRRRDLRADARLVALGYVVLRFDYYQILFQWDQVLDTIRLAIAQGADRRVVAPI
ncbi:DUF559 domain-containing protein [Microbacterium sp. 2FI]|uniref:DUF559 domain-containing protein n=1 Tax=Microbacterium sp. 2FI TaxID=2502193 RepID=UPI0010F59040|nr:DUF559 domain-containing protein [Microbacterium sp. 2FI]